MKMGCEILGSTDDDHRDRACENVAWGYYANFWYGADEWERAAKGLCGESGVDWWGCVLNMSV